MIAVEKIEIVERELERFGKIGHPVESQVLVDLFRKITQEETRRVSEDFPKHDLGVVGLSNIPNFEDIVVGIARFKTTSLVRSRDSLSLSFGFFDQHQPLSILEDEVFGTIHQMGLQAPFETERWQRLSSLSHYCLDISQNRSVSSRVSYKTLDMLNQVFGSLKQFTS